jgi:hypothetical protein
MSSGSETKFRPPPIVECISQGHCLGIGRKVYCPHKICPSCLQRYDPSQLQTWAKQNPVAISLINDQIHQKQIIKHNIESYGRYLCAFEDPDFLHCRWRLRDLNLRGTRLTCTTVRRKGTACNRCWKRHLLKIGIVSYFTPTGLCHEEADKVVTRSEDFDEGSEGEEDDVEGYDIALL